MRKKLIILFISLSIILSGGKTMEALAGDISTDDANISLDSFLYWKNAFEEAYKTPECVVVYGKDNENFTANFFEDTEVLYATKNWLALVNYIYQHVTGISIAKLGVVEYDIQGGPYATSPVFIEEYRLVRAGEDFVRECTIVLESAIVYEINSYIVYRSHNVEVYLGECTIIPPMTHRVTNIIGTATLYTYSVGYYGSFKLYGIYESYTYDFGTVSISRTVYPEID